MIKKTVMILLFLAMVPLAFTGCEVSEVTDGSGLAGDSSEVNSGDENSGSDITQKVLKVVDGNGRELGICTGSSYEVINIISKNGYYYNIFWDGSFFSFKNIYYSGESLTGTSYISKEKGTYTSIYAKVLFYSYNNSLLYTLSNLDSNNLGVKEDSAVTINSYEEYGGYSGSSEADNVYVDYYKLRTITREEAGIPENITLPIRLVEKTSD